MRPWIHRAPCPGIGKLVATDPLCQTVRATHFPEVPRSGKPGDKPLAAPVRCGGSGPDLESTLIDPGSPATALSRPASDIAAATRGKGQRTA